MIKKANIQWTAKQLTKMATNGTINFENSVQRGYVWDQKRKSLLIHSMIVGYPIPAFYASKDENGYSMLDGKQRSEAIRGFINNEYALTDIPEVETEDGFFTNIDGLKFSELSEEMQDTITGYSLTIYYFDGITDDEITEMFYRLNNGKPLSSIELTRVKTKSIDTIKRIGKHELFTAALTEKAMNKYTNEDITIKTWAVLNTENPSFETKSIRPIMETADITEQQEQDICNAFTRIKETYETILKDTTDEKLNVKIAKRVFTRTHLLSIVPVALHSIQNDISLIQFTAWVRHFFMGTKAASISEEYNENCSQGSARDYAVKARLDAVKEDYEKFFNLN